MEDVSLKRSPAATGGDPLRRVSAFFENEYVAKPSVIVTPTRSPVGSDAAPRAGRWRRHTGGETRRYVAECIAWNVETSCK